MDFLAFSRIYLGRLFAEDCPHTFCPGIGYAALQYVVEGSLEPATSSSFGGLEEEVSSFFLLPSLMEEDDEPVGIQTFRRTPGEGLFRRSLGNKQK